jgi:hypothetical protein
VVVGEAQRHLTLLTGAQADHRVVDLGQDAAGAHQELVAGLARRRVPVDRHRVVDHDEIAGRGRAIDDVELRLLLAHVLQRRSEVVGADRRRRVLNLDAPVVAERDRRLDLDDGDEAERRAFLQPNLLEVGLVHRIELRLGQRPAVHVGNQVLGDLAPHIVGKVHPDERARHVALSESRQPRLLLDATVGPLPFLLHDVGRRFDRQTPFAALD